MLQPRGRGLLIALLGTLLLADGLHSQGQEAEAAGRDLPPALAPLEFLIGRWKGQGVPKDNPALRFRGWTETHTWAWVFSKGEPAALSVGIQNGKLIGQGTLTFDTGQNRFRLDAREPGEAGKPVVFTGQLDRSGKRLVLVSSDQGQAHRLTIRPNSNYVRYTMTIERNEPGETGFTPRIEVGLTKEGESFAAGSSAAERPRCVVTGGAATTTVSYQGQDYPICCTGCRDEFIENPEKYLKKLALLAPASSNGKGEPAKTSRVSRFEDAFSGDVDEGEAKPKAAMKEGKEKASSSDPAEPGASKRGQDAKPATKAGQPEKAANRAATALRLAQNLEKSGKSAAALKSYKQILKDHPGTPQARTATERIKAIEAP
jgi:hypothetical protein